jgi:acyl-CoA synthetase (AMP-forming)/AMP-acid ligase II
VVGFWAVVSLGAVAVGYNGWWTRAETEFALGHTRPAVVLADARRAALLADHVVPVLTFESDLPAMVAAHPDEPLRATEVDEDEPAVILYTSGTSGRPKGVVHSHRNLTSVVEYHRFSDAAAVVFGSTVDPAAKRYLLALPLFHIASLHNLAVPRLATGTAVVMHTGGFDVDRVCRLIESERVTNWGAVPTMAHRLVERGDLSAYDLSSLSAFSLASAPSSPAFQDRLRAVLPAARTALVDSYGLTETCTAVAVATPADLAADPGTLGHPNMTVEMEIRDESGTALPEGTEGEICVRSAFTMLGYWEDPEATAAAFDENRWLRTGDIGMMTGGRVRLTARRSDLILRGGENVYPAEVEFALVEHPAVADCAVMGLAHDDLGQEVAAVVVTSSAVTEAELSEFLRDRVAYYKIPTRWRLTGDSLPRNATGKVIRNRVRF